MKFEPHGILPAMITPVAENGKIDEKALRSLIEYEIKGGLHGIFAVGTTGEFYAITDDMYREILSITVDQVGGRVPVYAGANAVSTREAIRLVKIAEDSGVDAVSVLTPYFISVSQQELAEHYTNIAASTNLPVLLYDNSPKTHISISPDTSSKLADIKNIVGMKDSSGDMTATAEHIRRNKGKDFHVMMGRDTLIYSSLCIGGSGAVAACANVAPGLCADIYNKFITNDLEGALEAQFKLAPLRMAFTLGSFPAVIKEALQMIGIPVGNCLRPTGKLNVEERAQLETILKNMELL
ncbi:4-hydroxy-tetrahydrodipicolinate synthase [Clostridium sp. AM58-1XD]|uniref:4-hydroxy-tetrahydrodipicolinate synthase n=1 Tax=Clostridium sp. AM58-1XD TaxID=2292307 RepID=UPI001A9A5E4B